MNVRSARRLLSSLLPPRAEPGWRVRLWDGTELASETAPAFTLHVRHPSALERVAGDPSMGFGEAYVAGHLDVEGDLGALLGLAYREDLFARLSPLKKARLCWWHLRGRSGLRRARREISHHYDRGNEFYRLWLDEGLNYSCAYFETPETDLETAQRAKNALVLRKAGLRPGHRLLDVGCGWGSLLLAAAETPGVRALGITLSERQLELARERIRRAGAADRVEVRLADYRELDPGRDGPFDRVVSVGMFEHVGRRNIPVFFERVRRLLKPRGLFLLHTIGRILPRETDPWIRAHIFPGGYIPALVEILPAAERAGFDFLDLENLRRHYHRTLGHWIERFEARSGEIAGRMGEAFVRMWRLYLHGSRAAFGEGDLHLFQLLYSRGRREDLPLTRRHFYEAAEGGFPPHPAAASP
ncbi:class I SAM-dependent methyltransferase [Dissulfurirhabdus thermomarina]|uniref:Class I SAM-dependent methyltransferase n=1 Tax=Dissulfurirhabdus thermomarina TaxID=1765737 RepID=A0A6N9TQD3_DISTH|nr:cyclopropane-fatty-acyl-phospholipid synthase family protein [Dissulfurirhabdus thermomarina]NDY43389.1 class I SAM-dependent methyltransferase [Dissulfurirhabdus thermomarina]NMX23253.1 class I SAM-dependent methyltransferase [Dissulfurirhabdus thermomarina]